MIPAKIDSTGKPGINPPGVTLRVSVNTCPPLVVTVIDWVEVTPFLLSATVYVPGGSVKVTSPCEFVTPCNGPGKHVVKAAGVTTTLTPESGLPWLSTTLMDTVTFDGHTMLVVDENVVVSAVVEVETVDTTIDVEVVENIPPNGENLSIVESGVL
jgi:hypothetical protein